MEKISINKVIILSGVIVFLFCANADAAAKTAIKQKRKDKVEVIKRKNSQWQLLVNGKPYFIKGVVYEPVKVGDKLTASNKWMTYDFNQNGICDTAYESWVDKNNNNIRDKNEPVAGDFALLKEMGCNTIRLYHHTNIDTQILRDLYDRFGIRVIMGNFLGAYTWGSGASWEKGTDYFDFDQRRNMLEDAISMVLKYKDEPYILFWMLGNENDMAGMRENSTFNNTNARSIPEVYAEFVNEVARVLHTIDPDHPVAVSNGNIGLLQYYAKYAPEVDILGFNAYKGPFGFGTLWNTVKMDFDRPVVITEYGTDCYNQTKDEIDEEFQAKYYKGCWQDMVNNSYGHKGAGSSIGGFAYIWLDSWWFCGLATEHDVKKGAWSGPSIDSWMNDEWLGICSQGDGSQSPFVRQLRKVYYMFSKEWRK